MKFPLAIVALVAAACAHAQPPAPPPAAASFARMGLYVVSDDLDRARRFYERLFAQPPQVATPGLLGFDVAGGLYAIVARGAYAPDAKRGDAVRPYIKVADIDAMFARLQAIAPDALESAAPVREGRFRFFRFVDPDGHRIEFFSVDPPPQH